MNITTISNLGDAVWLVMMLSRLDGEHTLGVKPEYVEALQPLLGHTRHKVVDINTLEDKGLDGWIADGQFESQGLYYTGQEDIMGFVMEYMNQLSQKLGHNPVFKNREDMLFDIPSIPEPTIPKIIDFLIIPSDPMSGQCPGYSRSEVHEKLIVPLQKRWKCVVTNAADNTHTGFTLNQIGVVSTLARNIIAVANGPHWVVHNCWTRETPKMVFLQPMRLRFCDPPIHHVGCADEAVDVATKLGWL